MVSRHSILLAEGVLVSVAASRLVPESREAAAAVSCGREPAVRCPPFAESREAAAAIDRIVRAFGYRRFKAEVFCAMPLISMKSLPRRVKLPVIICIDTNVALGEKDRMCVRLTTDFDSSVAH